MMNQTYLKASALSLILLQFPAVSYSTPVAPTITPSTDPTYVLKGETQVLSAEGGDTVLPTSTAECPPWRKEGTLIYGWNDPDSTQGAELTIDTTEIGDKGPYSVIGRQPHVDQVETIGPDTETPGRASPVVKVVEVKFELGNTTICDGESLDIEILVDPVEDKEQITDITVQLLNSSGGNTFRNVTNTGSTAAQVGEDEFVWEVENVKWYSAGASGNYDCVRDATYKIQATFKLAGVQKTIETTFTASASTGQLTSSACLRGGAGPIHNEVSPWTGSPAYTATKISSNPDLWEATASQGTLVRNLASTHDFVAPENSQFHDMVGIEEIVHSMQLEDDAYVGSYWTIQQLLDELNSNSVPFPTEAATLKWLKDSESLARLRTFNVNWTAVKANEQDRMEQDAKDEAGSTFVTSYDCTYGPGGQGQ